MIKKNWVQMVTGPNEHNIEEFELFSLGSRGPSEDDAVSKLTGFSVL